MMKQLLAPCLFKKIKFDLASSHKGKKRVSNTSETLKRLWQYLSYIKITLSWVGIIVISSSILSLLGPYIVGMAIDDFIVLKETTGFSTILLNLVIVYISYAIFIYLQNYLMVNVAQSTVYHMRADLFNQFHKLPISYFDTHQHGELMSRLTNDIDNVNKTLNQSVIQMFQCITTLIGSIIIMLLSFSHILTDLYNKLHKLPISNFYTLQYDELKSILTNDIDNVNTTLNQSVIQMFQSITTLIVTIIIMLILSPLLTVITFIIIPLL